MTDVLLLGDPRLRLPAQPVGDPRDPELAAPARRLVATLAAFRAAHGFGRAIAAPQIGLPRRLIAMDLGLGPFLVVDPVIVRRSRARFTLWDDCMSFPELFVRVRRSRSLTVRFRDGDGRVHEWADLDLATSELFQHEIDHLDGILAVDRAVDRDALVHRRAFAADPARYRAMVDAVIGDPPTPPRRP